MAQALITNNIVIGVMDCDTPSVIEQAIINTGCDKCVPIGNLLVEAGDTYEEITDGEFTRFEFRRNGGQVPVYRTPEQIIMDTLIADNLAMSLELANLKEVTDALLLDSLGGEV